MLTSPQNSPAPLMPTLLPSNLPTELKERLTKTLGVTRARVAAAALRHERDPSSVTLLAVSKLQPVEVVRAAADCGQLHFGENYLQEAVPKIAALADSRLVWHFIGQLQSNKTRPVAEHFQWVHTVDRVKIAERLSEQR